MYPVQHYLVGTPPRVFTMQLAWQSNSEKGSDIKLAMEALSQVNSFPQCAIYFCAGLAKDRRHSCRCGPNEA